MESEVTQLPLWQRAWAWFESNKKQTFWGIGLVAVAALIIGLILYRREQAAIAAGEALSNVALPQSPGAGRVPDANAYLKVAEEHPNSKAGARALLLAAGTLFTEGKYAEAKTQFERFTKEHSDSILRAEALLGIAASLDAQGKANDALNAYKSLVDHHPKSHVLPQAKFALARLYEGQNKPEQARRLYQEVEENNRFSSLGSEAGMKLEELNKKYPTLEIPASPALTNSVPLTPQQR